MAGLSALIAFRVHDAALRVAASRLMQFSLTCSRSLAYCSFRFRLVDQMTGAAIFIYIVNKTNGIYLSTVDCPCYFTEKLFSEITCQPGDKKLQQSADRQNDGKGIHDGLRKSSYYPWKHALAALDSFR